MKTTFSYSTLLLLVLALCDRHCFAQQKVATPQDNATKWIVDWDGMYEHNTIKYRFEVINKVSAKENDYKPPVMVPLNIMNDGNYFYRSPVNSLSALGRPVCIIYLNNKTVFNSEVGIGGITFDVDSVFPDSGGRLILGATGSKPNLKRADPKDYGYDIEIYESGLVSDENMPPEAFNNLKLGIQPISWYYGNAEVRKLFRDDPLPDGNHRRFQLEDVDWESLIDKDAKYVDIPGPPLDGEASYPLTNSKGQILFEVYYNSVPDRIHYIGGALILATPDGVIAPVKFSEVLTPQFLAESKRPVL